MSKILDAIGKVFVVGLLMIGMVTLSVVYVLFSILTPREPE